ncbi:MAG: amidase, partial [Granulicatella sp.]|nr:amidase [Granulicatella sp.]
MFRDATSMAQAVRNKQVSPLELVLETIEKAEWLNPRLNAIVSTRYEEAIEEAKKFQVKNQPFAGVPLFLKDLGQEKEGTPCTYGSCLFKDYICHETSHFVKRLEELGFIILGRTNTPEFGYKMVSDAQLHGSVCHFLDETVNAGGSSGGAAAIVAAGISPMSAASDGGGSIRVPAS